MNYVLDNGPESAYNIIETDTGLVIKLQARIDQARELVRALNAGSGFGGFTPPFFTERFLTNELQVP